MEIRIKLTRNYCRFNTISKIKSQLNTHISTTLVSITLRPSIKRSFYVQIKIQQNMFFSENKHTNHDTIIKASNTSLKRINRQYTTYV